MEKNIQGQIHSFEPFGTFDGPGIRFVVFLQGCPLRCAWCHNPDSWKMGDGRPMSVDDVMEKISHYRSFMASSGGGVTITGGEPLMQPEFVREIFRRCRELKIHTTLDTSGYTSPERADGVLDFTDLVLMDLKCLDKQLHRDYTGGDLEIPLRFAEHLSSRGIPLWVRHVLVPGVTDSEELLTRLAQFILTLKGVERVEILPFHKMGEYKWENLKIPYRLKDTPPPTEESLRRAIQIFRDRGLPVQ
jgi:pyruvate formate lyase activating enzyme